MNPIEAATHGTNRRDEMVETLAAIKGKVYADLAEYTASVVVLAAMSKQVDSTGIICAGMSTILAQLVEKFGLDWKDVMRDAKPLAEAEIETMHAVRNALFGGKGSAENG